MSAHLSEGLGPMITCQESAVAHGWREEAGVAGCFSAASSSETDSEFFLPLLKRKEHCELLGSWLLRLSPTSPSFQGNQEL